MIYTQDLCINNKKGDDAPPNQSSMSAIFKNTFNNQEAVQKAKNQSFRKNSILLIEN